MSEGRGSIRHVNFWESVAESVASEHVSRARQLVAAERVTLLEVDTGESEAAIDAIVRDATPRGDQTQVVSFSLDPVGGRFESYCSCGEAPECSHVAASLLAVAREHDDKAQARTSTPVAQRPQDPTPPWQRALDQVLPPSRRRSAEATDLCLFVSLDDGVPTRWSRGRQRPSLRVRPGMRGARGAWIKGQARWDRLDTLGADPRAVSLLDELGSYDPFDDYGWQYRSSDDEWMRLDTVPSRTLWSLFETLQATGVALVSPGKRQHPVHLGGDPLTAVISVTDRRRRLAVAAELTTEGGAPWQPESPPLFIGSPAVAVAQVTGAGTAEERTVIHRLSQPVPAELTELFHLRGPVSVDGAGRERFETDYLPRLQALGPVVSPDDSYAVPRAPETILELRIEHADRQARLSWQWDRAGGTLLPDPDRESMIIDGVRRAATTHVAMLFREGPEGDRPPDQTLSGTSAVLFVAEVLPALRALDEVRVVEDTAPASFHAAHSAPAIAIAADPGVNDWFDLSVKVTIDGEDVDFGSLFRALSTDEPILVLPSGTYFPLDTPELQRLHDLIAEASTLSDRPTDRPQISRYQADLWEELVEMGVVARQELEWWMKVRALTDHDRLLTVDPPPTLRATLRDYQRTGLSWLHFLRTHGLGGVLADDMGLGKTLQTIAMIEKARVDGDTTAPFLIVAPTSVVGNWAAECEKFAPGLSVSAISATASRRGTTLADAAADAHVVVTSYALFRLEFDAYAGLDWAGLILDEAQQIKNPSSQGYRCARMLDAPFTLVITGTPLENNLLELWALVSLACPGLLGARRAFTEHFRTPIERERDIDRLRTLQRRIRPFLLRRTKELVAAELPPKQEQELVLTLHPAHQKLYDRRLNRERQKVLGLVDDVGANRFEIFRSLTLLRQLALSPELVDEGTSSSAKLDALVDLLTEAAAEGHRALVLSQFTRFLTRARDAVEAAGITSQYLDGSTANRTAVIDRFRTGDDPAFFVSLKAGGVGLNLVEADYVVLLDPWWNPAVEAQAIDRAHRIGQTRPVIVYRLIAKNTIEEKVMTLQKSKAQLFARVLDADADTAPTVLTADDIRGLVE